MVCWTCVSGRCMLEFHNISCWMGRCNCHFNTNLKISFTTCCKTYTSNIHCVWLALKEEALGVTKIQPNLVVLYQKCPKLWKFAKKKNNFFHRLYIFKFHMGQEKVYWHANNFLVGKSCEFRKFHSWNGLDTKKKLFQQYYLFSLDV
jgi:hypothetical protein